MASTASTGASGNYMLNVTGPQPANRLFITTAIALTETQILAMLEILRTDYAASALTVGYDATNNGFYITTLAGSSPA